MFSRLPVRPSSQWISTICCYTSLLTLRFFLFLPLTEPDSSLSESLPLFVSGLKITGCYPSLSLWIEERLYHITRPGNSWLLWIFWVAAPNFAEKGLEQFPSVLADYRLVARGEDMLRSGYQLSGKETFFDSLLGCTQFWMQKVGQLYQCCIVSAIPGFLDIHFYY